MQFYPQIFGRQSRSYLFCPFYYANTLTIKIFFIADILQFSQVIQSVEVKMIKFESALINIKQNERRAPDILAGLYSRPDGQALNKYRLPRAQFANQTDYVALSQQFTNLFSQLPGLAGTPAQKCRHPFRSSFLRLPFLSIKKIFFCSIICPIILTGVAYIRG